jgi:hypothetical protein
MSKRLSVTFSSRDAALMDVDVAVAEAFGTDLNGIGAVIQFGGVSTYLSLEDRGDVIVHVVTGRSLTRERLRSALKACCARQVRSQFGYAGGGGHEGSEGALDLSF